MAEQGLKAVVYPELDDTATAQFVKDLNEQISSTLSIQVGVPAVSTTASSPSGAIATSSGQADTSPTSETAQATQQVVQNAIENADTNITNDKKKTDEKNKPITDTLAGLITEASNVVGGITGILGVGMNVMKFLENSSPPLRNVMSLFEQAFNLIWMPVGTILAVQLMPVLRSVMTKVADWMAIAFKLYEEEGMVGLVRGAIELSFEVLMELLSNKDFLDMVGALLWAVFELTTPGMLLKKVLGNDGYWELLPKLVDWFNNDFMSFIYGVEDFFKPVSNFFNGLTIDNFLDKLINMWKEMWVNLIAGLIDFFSNDFVNMIINAMPGGSMISNTVSTVQSWLGMAEGGVVTEPTWRLFGEAGPEAVIPLNQLSSVVNDYNSNVVGGNSSSIGGNNIVINISGGNAMEIGTEVQRVLEKTVGKASSKLLWW